VIDIDILLYDTCIIATPTLTIPHPRLAERGFVLRPLAEIAPEAIHPALAKTVGAILAAAQDLEENRLFAPPDWWREDTD